MKYCNWENFSSAVISKIRNSEKLTAEEINYVVGVLTDPLQEFCARESIFRLVEIHNVSVDKANELAEQATNVIRDTIDNCDYLYDAIDLYLREDLKLEKGEN